MRFLAQDEITQLLEPKIGLTNAKRDWQRQWKSFDQFNQKQNKV